MNIALLGLLSLLTTMWLWLLASRAHRENFRQTLDTTTDLPEISGPARVFVIIPARNESAMLPQTVPSICRQKYSDVQVVLVDDQSEDESPDVIQQLSRQHSNLRSVQGKPRPEGWMGKCWAVKQGVDAIADHYTDSLFLFTDADVVFESKAVIQAARFLRANKLDALSIFPRAIFGQTIESIAMAGLITMLGTMFPLGWVNDPKRKCALAAGGFFLIRAEAYRAIGGHECVKGHLIEDVNLARKLKASGAQIACRHTRDLCTTRMYEGFADVWEGLAKNAYAGMEYQPHKFWIGLVIAIAAAVLPPVYLLVALIWAARTNDSIAWISGALAATMNLCIIAIHARTTRHLRLPWYHALFMPLSAALYTAIACASFWQHHFSGGNVWKGRRYAREMLLRGTDAAIPIPRESSPPTRSQA